MSVRKFNSGDTAFINEKISSSFKAQGFTPGTQVLVDFLVYQGYYRVTFKGNKYNIPSKYLSKGTPKSSIEIFTEQIEKAEAKIEATKNYIAETKSKIAFMKETGSEVFDENEFKAYHTLTIIEQSGMSKIEKAKAIAALIAGK